MMLLFRSATVLAVLSALCTITFGATPRAVTPARQAAQQAIKPLPRPRLPSWFLFRNELRLRSISPEVRTDIGGGAISPREREPRTMKTTRYHRKIR
jgi:hypothetical protein